MVRVAVGVMGVPLSDLLTWTVRDYQLACEGYQIRNKEEWERTRTLSYYTLVSIAGSKGIQYKDITLPIDENSAKDKKRVKWRRLTG